MAAGDRSPDASAPSKFRRAGRACLACRARKVRCNVVESSPCDNCKWDRVQCVVPRTRRSRKVIFQAHDSSSPQTVYCDAQDIGPSHSRFDGTRAYPTPLGNPSPSMGTTPENPGNSAAAHSPQLPPFIRAPSIDDPAFTAFLQSQGAFKLPSIPLQCALLKSYIDFAYPRMPVIDLEDFCNALRSADGSTGQVNLSLYQAILFAGAAHVSTDVLVDDGFPDKEALRRELYQRSELLFDLGGEQDRLVLVQIALLLTSRSVPENHKKDSWYWMNTAVSFAFAIGLHHDPAKKGVAASEARLLRRIWWGCYVRDKVVSLGLGRPSRVKDGDYNVPMLHLADTEVGILSSRRILLGHDGIGPYEETKQVESAELLIEKTKLFMLINRILHLQTQNGDPPDAYNSTDATNGNAPPRQAVEVLDAAVKSWLRDLPPSCRWKSLASGRQHGNMSMSIHLRRHLLHIMYYTALYTLHRPRFLPCSSHQTSAVRSSRKDREISRSVVLDSANKITHLAAELHQYKMDYQLPLTAITVLCPAMFMHLLNMKSQKRDIREAAIFSFRMCMRTMERLRDIYSCTDFTTMQIEVVLRSASAENMPWPTGSVLGVFKLNQQDHTDVSAVLGYGQSPTDPEKMSASVEGAGNVSAAEVPSHERFRDQQTLPDVDPNTLYQVFSPGQSMLTLESNLWPEVAIDSEQPSYSWGGHLNSNWSSIDGGQPAGAKDVGMDFFLALE